MCLHHSLWTEIVLALTNGDNEKQQETIENGVNLEVKQINNNEHCDVADEDIYNTGKSFTI